MPALPCAQHVVTGEGEPPWPSRALLVYCMRIPCVLDAVQWEEESVAVLRRGECGSSRRRDAAGRMLP